MNTVRLDHPGPLLAALQACGGAQPAWLTAVTPRCATGAAPLDLDDDQAEQLADLSAACWWECQQAADPECPDPFTTAFATACEDFLTRHRPGPGAPR